MKMYFKKVPFFALSLFFATLMSSSMGHSAPNIQAKSQLLGFKAWKNMQVINARNALDSYKAERLQGKVTLSSEVRAKEERKSGASKEAGEALRQFEFNLEISLGLTIHDYFALYLKNMEKVEISKVITKLSPEELSELLFAYRNQLYGPPQIDKRSSSKIK